MAQRRQEVPATTATDLVRLSLSRSPCLHLLPALASSAAGNHTDCHPGLLNCSSNPAADVADASLPQSCIVQVAAQAGSAGSFSGADATFTTRAACLRVT